MAIVWEWEKKDLVPEEDKVPKKHHDQLSRSVQLIGERVKKNKSHLPKDLFDTLEEFLDGKNQKERVLLFIDPDESKGLWGHSSGYCIWLTPQTFAPWKDIKPRTPRLSAVLLHELVHAAGGMELDAETFENMLFTHEEGASAPSEDDWPEFEAQHYEGWWCYLDRNSKGRVIDLWRRDVHKFLAAVKRSAKGGSHD